MFATATVRTDAKGLSAIGSQSSAVWRFATEREAVIGILKSPARMPTTVTGSSLIRMI
jgi:hypothetical protein